MFVFKSVFVFLILLLGAFGINAQESLAPAGNYNECRSGSLSWVMGDLVQAGSSTLNNNVVTDSLQNINDGSSSFSPSNFDYDFSAYPNPFTDYVILKIDEEMVANSILNIFSIGGSLVLTVELNSNINTIKTNSLNEGVYSARIQFKDKSSQSFVMLKSN